MSLRIVVNSSLIFSSSVIPYFRGTKLSWLGHHAGIHEKTFAFASKQCPQVPKHFDIHRKIFVVQAKTTKSTKVLALERFVLYGTSHYDIVYQTSHRSVQ